MNNQLFKRIGRARPPRSLFNLSYEKKLTADMGQLIPIMCDECVPGDIWDISAAAVVRCQPLVAPPLHQVDLTVHYFFVPYRLIWDDWEDFITGGVTGSLAPALPLWIPDDQTSVDPGSLWDYFGFPPILPNVGDTMGPIDFPLRAYNFLHSFAVVLFALLAVPCLRRLFLGFQLLVLVLRLCLHLLLRLDIS